jgi:hypothetical protein
MAKNGVTIAFEPSTSLACSTCHTNFQDFSLYQTNEVKFPSGAVLTFGEGMPADLCLNCHQGVSPRVCQRAAIAKVGG